MLLFQNIRDSNYHYQPIWVLIIIVLSLLILGYLYAAYNKRFHTFINSVISARFFSQSSREERSLSHPFSLLLFLNFILTLSLFILQLISSKVFFNLKIDFSFLPFLFILIIISVLYFVKILFLKIAAFIIDKQELISEYIFTILLGNKFLGVILIPIVVIIAYGESSFINGFIYFGVVLIVAVFIARIGKGVSTVLINRESSLFYLILYLCTLEILPLLLGWKFFEKLVGW